MDCLVLEYSLSAISSSKSMESSHPLVKPLCNVHTSLLFRSHSNTRLCGCQWFGFLCEDRKKERYLESFWVKLRLSWPKCDSCIQYLRFLKA